mmetsp:Transcript_9092/g.10498  ORF Transcript_9092/g.10498 Transcript_9092/m.10498 type:complete len:535 (+) Transcript_9092:48-1652(+)|eukprot:CAMPEP_0194353682 /NCGR_PEP_ID=MMETSP0174-20130528/1964_1 /TAXON_ID=216777 /ORGANISM="Proboscia alata, Strain PI-D3" /LENGTH=534 /DNA_ID=CAMNT_0039122337 /DNA_START=24 /DNA_END=1628 /DNA_ORIENTATION=+
MVLDKDKKPSPPPTRLIQCDNFINNKFQPPSSGEYISIYSPSTSSQIGTAALSTSLDVDDAIAAAKSALSSWSKNTTMKSRVSILLKFHSLVVANSRELAELIVLENGKNITEALADVAKGNETVEYACSLPQLAAGRTLTVSRGGVSCQESRQPLGIVTSIVPFNFPFMVPMWTVPIALIMGNCVLLKPSEKVPLTMRRVAEIFVEAGLPRGVFGMLQGSKEVVEGLIDHPDVKAVTFVGSSPVASAVATRCRNLNKRVVALGGAKNHLVALPDCDIESASSDIVVSYAGCAGQRCMAASVLLLAGNSAESQFLLDKVVEKAKAAKAGTGGGCVGPVIDEVSYTKIMRYIEEAERSDAKILLDGRQTNDYLERTTSGSGFWIGPTIIHHMNSTDAAMKHEIFGPVLSVYTVSSWQEAIDIENNNPFGNAACVYTVNGGAADWFTSRFRAAMLGVNIGIPVPREPFSFGGLYGTQSKYGDMDITGDGAMEFFSNRIKITTRWPFPAEAKEGGVTENGTSHSSGVVDHANFAGRM